MMAKGRDELLKALKKEKVVAMLAPSFISEFDYPDIIYFLRSLGFDKVVELTFGAKIVNKEYHKYLKNSNKILISSVCPGIVELIKVKYPEYYKNLIPVVSPMIATAMICNKVYSKHKTCFIAPCNFKKIEARDKIDFVIDFRELREMIKSCNTDFSGRKNIAFDRFYNEYTRIYPLSGGLSKTANFKGVLKSGEEKVIDGYKEVEKFLKNPDKAVKFLDVTYCAGGCVGGPLTNQKISISNKVKKVKDYLNEGRNMTIPKSRKGLLRRAKGIDLSVKY